MKGDLVWFSIKVVAPAVYLSRYERQNKMNANEYKIRLQHGPEL